MADSFAGEAGLPAFERGLSRLLNLIDSTEGTGRLALADRSRQDWARRCPTRPAITATWRVIARSSSAVARQRSAPFVDLFDWFGISCSQPRTREPPRPTYRYRDGIHLTEDGYWGAAVLVCHGPASGPLGLTTR